ncbi:MAG: LacI family DNA-binding transcriptional regulator [Acidobacteriota bacterium]|nr:LacI family DNA-binding transcriptional regulator [Acidobacteriota bacterium]
MTTIREIAKMLGVSFSTVSAVINNRQYVSAAMRSRVEKALRDANYQPNSIARSLRLRESRTIGLIVPNLGDPFYSSLMRGAEDYLCSVGYRMIVAESREDWKRQQDYLTSFSGMITDGIILATCGATDEQIATLPDIVRGAPLVYVDRCPLESKGISVSVDNVQAASDATQYLIGLGHERIAIITGPLNVLNASERFKGYKSTLRVHGIPLDRTLVRAGDHTEDSGYWHGSELLGLANRPTAVLGCGLLITLGVLAAIREKRVACPQEISLIGFDDFAWSTLLSPALTMVRQPAAELGAAAAKAVLKRMREPDQNMVDKVLLPTQLMIRESTAPPAQRNPTPK